MLDQSFSLCDTIVSDCGDTACALKLFLPTNKNSMEGYIQGTKAAGTTLLDQPTCIEKCGSSIKEKYPKAIMSIMRKLTMITRSKTLIVCLARSIFRSTTKVCEKDTRQNSMQHSAHGLALKKGKNFFTKAVKETRIFCMSRNSLNANAAAMILLLLMLAAIVSVQTNAKPNGAEILAQMMKQEIAQSVGKSTASIGIPDKSIAAVNAEPHSRSEFVEKQPAIGQTIRVARGRL